MENRSYGRPKADEGSPVTIGDLLYGRIHYLEDEVKRLRLVVGAARAYVDLDPNSGEDAWIDAQDHLHDSIVAFDRLEEKK